MEVIEIRNSGSNKTSFILFIIAYVLYQLGVILNLWVLKYAANYLVIEILFSAFFSSCPSRGPQSGSKTKLYLFSTKVGYFEFEFFDMLILTIF